MSKIKIDKNIIDKITTKIQQEKSDKIFELIQREIRKDKIDSILND